MESFGSRLSAARKSRGWKQPELAAASGVDQGAISRYERDLAEPLLSKANLLAKALEIPIEYLLGQAPGARPASDPVAALHKRIAELELENQTLKRRLAAIEKVIGKK